ncbi:MAG: phosphoglycerate kinase [Candidatus Melainabacteria bacterium RIFOXYA12_FULL_32_12]|nr:MAG: phosphoglycerate kinase [Candidatus Melainabacteria bacterium RIFOXYA2_FULL_32_9]OGI26888.1 MAG: phosphoglycerate kinase [Candidatus Melainabacteria bacterium RIFOXYA12_FULL_32_12]
MKTIKDVDVRDKKVLLREDFNVPLKDHHVSNNSRIKAALPTINYLREQGAKVILISELGKPEGQTITDFRMNPVAEELEKLLKTHIESIDEIFGVDARTAISNMHPGDVILLENLGFHKEEYKNDDWFAHGLANLADIYVDDDFRIANEEHASNIAITNHIPSYAGLLMEKELDQIVNFILNIDHPFVLLMGGKNPESKMPVIERFIEIADYILVAGEVGLTFLKAQGHEIGKANISDTAVEMAKQLMCESKLERNPIILPDDFLVAEEIRPGASHNFVSRENIPKDWHVVDIGPRTFEEFNKLIYEARRVIWNGPVGVIEIADFENGNRSIAQTIASTDASTMVGGIDTVNAIYKYDKASHINVVSTGGISFIDVLQAKDIPAIRVLE